jgi:hypothetical protein
MLRELKIYWRLRPYINQEKELIQMKFSFNVIAQAIATAMQGANAISGMFGPKTQTAIALGIGMAQAIIAFVAHFSTPPDTIPAN